MQSSTTSSLTHHVRDVAVLFEHGASPFLIPSKAQRGNQGGGHDCCIVHLTLTVFLMMYGFQQIVTQTEGCNSHGLLTASEKSGPLVSPGREQLQGDMSL